MSTHQPSPLVGCAVADALGMPFETEPSTSEHLLAWDGTYQASEYHKLKPGQWTDDTMMSRILAESLVSCNGFYPKDVADRYRFWFAQGPESFRGMGKATKEALGRLNSNWPWWQSGSPSEGNGTAMRAAPLGYFYREDLATIVEFARLDSRITHRSIETEMGSVAVAIGAALLGTPGAELGQEFVEKVASWVDNDCKLKLGLLQVARYIAEKKPVAEALQEIGTKAHVVQTVPAAFAALCLSTGGYEGAVRAAIFAGGDTDTTAAITGALAGIFYGYNEIPKKFTKDLEDHEKLHSLEVKLKKGPRGDALWKI